MRAALYLLALATRLARVFPALILAKIFFWRLSPEKLSDLLLDCLLVNLYHFFKLKVIIGCIHFTFELLKFG